MKRDASDDEPDEYSTDEGEEEDGEEEEEGSEDGEGTSSSFGLPDLKVKLQNTLKGSKKNKSCE